MEALLTKVERGAMVDQKVTDIINRAQEGKPPSYEEVLYLLELDEVSPEATAVRGAANDIARAKTGNTAVMLGQIGIDVYPCEADCQFCAFAKSTTCFTEHATMPVEEVVKRAIDFTCGGDLYAIYLMTMHSYKESYVLECVREVRKAIPPQTQIVANIGDTDKEFWLKLKEAGLDGVYHVKRLGEGTLTNIPPERREATIRAAWEAGLTIEDCCEPMGAETTNEDIATRLFEIRTRSIEMGLRNVAVMKRNGVPGTPFEGLQNEITDMRLALVGAIEALMMVDQDPFPWLPVHEPNTVSLLSGANTIWAEQGYNPRDTAEDTAGNRGLDVPALRQMFYQAGFRKLLLGDGTTIDLTPEYMTAKLAGE